jgi:hypothetical protein
MTKTNPSSRRSFLKTGALLAAPLAAAVPTAALADDGLKARLKRLEDEAAIRELHQNWLRRVNAAPRDDNGFDKSVRRITADHTGAADRIEVAADGRSATGRFSCTAELETPLAQDCTLAQMAHAQGDGFIRRTERRVLKVDYAKTGDAWAIAKVTSTPL